MNINSYGSYSSSSVNSYAPADSGTQTTPPTSQETLQNSSSQPSSAPSNDFSVNISQEARESSLNETQPLPTTSSETLETTSTAQTQQTEQVQQMQPTQQMQSQLYQSSYAGQMAVSRTQIDLMA